MERLGNTIKHRQAVSKATSDDESPTPGYMFNDFAKMTHDGAQCRDLEDLLLGRLEKKSPHVKLKTLRIIKSVAERGHPNFKRDLQRRTQPIRDSLHFQGDMHPTLGDLPNKLVREAAQEAMTAVFDTETKQTFMDQGFSGGGGGGGGGMGLSGGGGSSFGGGGSGISDSHASRGFGNTGGFGSDDYSRSGAGYSGESRDLQSYGSGPSGGGGGGRYGGFGNPQFGGGGGGPPEKGVAAVMGQAKDVGGKALDVVKGLGGKAFDQIQSKVHSPSKMGGFGKSGPQGGSVGGLYAGHGFQGSSFQTASGTAGSSSFSTFQPAQPSLSLGGSSGGGGGDRKSAKAPSGEYEAKLVNEITAPGGVRAVPPRDALKQFCHKCDSLHMDTVLERLNEKLDDSQWQTRLKALHVLDALLRSSVRSDVKHFLRDNPDNLHLQQESSQSSIRDMAAKVIGGVDGGGGHHEAPAPAEPSGGGAAQPDLFGLNGDAPAPAPAPVNPLFAGLDMGGAAPAPAPAPRPARAQAPAPAPAPAPAGFDFMADLDAPPAASPAPAPAPAPAAGGLDAFDFINASPPQPAAEPAPSGERRVSAEQLSAMVGGRRESGEQLARRASKDAGGDQGDGLTDLERELMGGGGRSRGNSAGGGAVMPSPEQMAMQQMMMQQQMMMMQQQMMRMGTGGGGVPPGMGGMGGGMPGMMGGGMGGGMGGMGMGGGMPAPGQVDAGAAGGFSFMGGQKDAFDFVGDAMKAQSKTK